MVWDETKFWWNKGGSIPEFSFGKKNQLKNWKFYTVHGVEMLKRYVALILPTNQTEFGF